MIDFEAVLNPQQYAACTHESGPLLILAGAGSGKTRVITHRIAWLVLEQNANPDAILAVTFTNKAANEMLERVQELLGPVVGDVRPHIGTFHAIGARLLRQYAARLGLTRRYSIYDETDQLKMLERCAEETFFSREKARLREYRGWIESWKNQGRSPDDVHEAAIGPEQESKADLYTLYTRRMKEANAVDFGDLINLIPQLARQDRSVRRHLKLRWDWILVDEFQDTNPAQYAFLDTLVDKHTQLTVVGDDDQSIYRWRGADPGIMLQFPERNDNVTVVKLEQNYRSTQPILDVASDLIAANTTRLGKRLWTEQSGGDEVRVYGARDERDEARFISRTIRQRCLDQSERYDQVAVFVRINAMTRVLEEQLRGDGVPHRIVGTTGFYDRMEVKDLLAYLQVVNNPFDIVSIDRVLNVPTRGIGKKTQQRLDSLYARTARESREATPDDADALEDGERPDTLISFYDVLKAVAAGDMEVKGGARVRNAVREFVEIIEEARGVAASGEGPIAVLDFIVRTTNYQEWLERRSGERAETTLANVDELFTAVQEYQESVAEPTLDGFLEKVSLVPTNQEETADGEVALMTIHSAKGLEFDTVFVTGMEENILPYARRNSEPDIEEERRLCYVAFTRARQRLYLTMAASRRLHGTSRYGRPSRFFRDLDPDAIEWLGQAGPKFANTWLEPKTSPQSSRSSWGGYRKRQAPSKDDNVDYVPDYESESQVQDWNDEPVLQLDSEDVSKADKKDESAGGPRLILDEGPDDSVEPQDNPDVPETTSRGSGELGQGSVVTHNIYGIGEVDRVEESAGKLWAWVVFVGKGERKIRADFLRRM